MQPQPPRTVADGREWRRRHPYYSYYEAGWVWWCIWLWFFIALVILIGWSLGSLAPAHKPPPVPPGPLNEQQTYKVQNRVSAEATAPRVRIGHHWKKEGPGTYALGAGSAPGYKDCLKGWAHLIYAEGYGPQEDELPTSSNLTSPCVGPLAEGVRWREGFRWVVDPTNGNAIPRMTVVDAMWNAANEFQRRLPQGTNIILGQDTENCADGVDADSPDEFLLNEIMMGFIEEEGVLAIMFGWTDPSNILVTADIIFNLHFPWGNSSVEANVYDLCSVATHEMGHALGLAHTGTSLATMQPTAGRDETHKRDLLPCEAAGLCNIYGLSDKACATYSSPPLAPFVDVGPQSRCGAGTGGGGGGGGTSGGFTPSTASTTSVLPWVSAVVGLFVLVV